MADASDRKLPASERKIRKAREEGQVARSRDLGHFAALGAALLALNALAPAATGALQQAMASSLRFDARRLAQPDVLLQHLLAQAQPLFMAFLLCGALAVAVAVAGAMLAGGWNFAPGALRLHTERFDPIAGLQRMFSWHQLGDTLKTCGLVLVLVGVAAWYAQRSLPQFQETLHLGLPAAAAHSATVLRTGLLWMVVALAIFALVDVPLQRMRLLSQLKMSVTEAKQESKESEGNSEVRARQKARMRELSNRRMLAAVPAADLVVMNPSHFAVALKYDEATMAAPRVLAKGADLMAFRIRDAASAAGVPVLRTPPLARALYAHAELDREIPAALFAAVAQVLAHVYALREALAGRTPMPELPQALPVPPELDPQHGQAEEEGR